MPLRDTKPIIHTAAAFYLQPRSILVITSQHQLT